MTKVNKTQREQLFHDFYIRGLPIKVVSEKYGISSRHAYRIIKEARDRRWEETLWKYKNGWI